MCDSSKPMEEQEDTQPADETTEDISTAADMRDPEKYQEVFRPRHKLCELSHVFEKINCVLFYLLSFAPVCTLTFVVFLPRVGCMVLRLYHSVCWLDVIKGD